jgi:hypothetical protein
MPSEEYRPSGADFPVRALRLFAGGFKDAPISYRAGDDGTSMNAELERMNEKIGGVLRRDRGHLSAWRLPGLSKSATTHSPAGAR